MARLIVPVIDVDLPVFPGVDESALGRGAGWLPGTSLPVGGARTRSVIAGHSGRLEADYLTRLDELAQGDIFLVEVLGETLAYRVTDTRAVDPRDLTALRLEDDRDLVTLVTCTPRGENTHRLLVTGERIDPTTATDLAAEAQLSRDAPGAGPPWWLPVLLLGTLAILVLTRPRDR